MSTRPIRVLVADDSADMLAALVELVRSCRGMELAGAALDADAALEALPSATADVAVLDVRMPGGGGARVAREVAARWPQIAVIALSAFANPSAVAEMRSAGAVAYLVKGVHSADEIEAAIRRAAERSNEKAEWPRLRSSLGREAEKDAGGHERKAAEPSADHRRPPGGGRRHPGPDRE